MPEERIPRAPLRKCRINNLLDIVLVIAVVAETMNDTMNKHAVR
jgi:hypothetical protein